MDRPGGVDRPGLRRGAVIVGLAWLLSVGFDFLLHGGILAGLYADPGPFLLPAEDAFRRIPLGYLSFLVLTAGLYWLLLRLGVRDTLAGFRVGLVAGLVLWVAMAVGLYSITTAEPAVLAGWGVGQGVELALAGAVIGRGLGGASLRRLGAKVTVAVVILVAGAVVLQSTGLAPPGRTISP